MSDLTLIVCDGAGTKNLPPEDPKSVLAPVVERLRWRTGAKVWNTGWEASVAGVGGSTPWPIASHRAVLRIADYIATHDGRFILLGFSAGCRPVREFLERHPEFRDRVVAVGQLADPWAPRGRQQNGVPNPPGHGIMGERLGPIASRTFWCHAPGDPIPRAAWDSLLRHLTPAAEKLPGQFVVSFLEHAHFGRVQLIPFLGLPPHEWFAGLGARIGRSREEANSYLFAGGHTTAYRIPFHTADGKADPLVHRFADTIAWKVNHP